MASAVKENTHEIHIEVLKTLKFTKLCIGIFFAGSYFAKLILTILLLLEIFPKNA